MSTTKRTIKVKGEATINEVTQDEPEKKFNFFKWLKVGGSIGSIIRAFQYSLH